MKLNVPFYKQETENDCGPTALQMVLEYLGVIKHSKKEIIEAVDSDKSGVTWSLGLAKAAAQFGFKVEFYTICLGLNPKNYELDFYKKQADESSSAKQKLFKLKLEADKLDVKMEERSLSLKERLSKISENCIPVILLNWKIINNGEGYQGHFVPIVGFDEENVYVHNSADDSGKFFLIEKELFDKARKSKGTDEDIIFIIRKSKKASLNS